MTTDTIHKIKIYSKDKNKAPVELEVVKTSYETIRETTLAYLIENKHQETPIYYVPELDELRIYNEKIGYYERDSHSVIIHKFITEYLSKQYDRTILTDNWEIKISGSDITVGEVHDKIDYLFGNWLYRISEAGITKTIAKYKLYLIKNDRIKAFNDFFPMGRYDKTNKNLILNLKNTTIIVDTDTNEIKDVGHHSGWLFGRSLPVKYDPKSKCNLWMEKLEEIVPKEEDREVIRHYFAYTLMPGFFWWQSCLFFLGPGYNGKSVIAETWGKAFANPSYAKLSQLTAKWGLQDLENSDILIAGESNKQVEDSSLLKSIIVGEQVRVERRYINSIEKALLDLKIIITANDEPQLEKISDSRRYRFVLFPRDFDSRDILDLKEQLAREINGIFYWVITSVAEFMNKLSDHKRNQRIKTEKFLESRSDPIGDFYFEFTSFMKGAKEPGEDLLIAYNFIAYRRAHQPISQIMLTKKLKETNPQIISGRVTINGKQTRGYNNIRLNRNKLEELDPEWIKFDASKLKSFFK